MGVPMNPDARAWTAMLARQAGGRPWWWRLRQRVEGFLAGGDLSYERNFLMVRPAIAMLVIVAVLVPGIPGARGVVYACLCAMAYNFLLAFFVFKRRIYMLRVTSLLCDQLTVISASLFVFWRMGVAGYESDLWLIYITLILTSCMYYGPIGSLFFTALWTSLLVIVTYAFYDAGSHMRDQLPMRLSFFVLTGLVSISLSAELRKGRDKLERQSRQTLSMLATIVEARDTDAGEHLGHVTHYSRALALHLGMSDDHANEIAYAAMIHDVGKAQVPDAILKKPGPLTVEERREIERHTIWGWELLADNEEFSIACDVARSHHERWDGTGYPDGLRGDDIPLAARIAAVADVFDALTSQRPYKDAWPTVDAIEEIKRLRGSHLDPTIVDAFLNLYYTGVLETMNREMRDTPPGFELAA
jgi:hypothetical protein